MTFVYGNDSYEVQNKSSVLCIHQSPVNKKNTNLYICVFMVNQNINGYLSDLTAER